MVRPAPYRLPVLALTVTACLAVASGSARAAGEEVVAFSSAPPTHAVVGGSYKVQASETPSGTVYIAVSGACSFRTVAEVRKQPTIAHKLAPAPPPVVVHFIKAGTCLIDATGIALEYGESPPQATQSIVVAKASRRR